jgi:hypothetical protein
MEEKHKSRKQDMDMDMEKDLNKNKENITIICNVSTLADPRRRMRTGT